MEEKVTTRYVFMMMLALADRHGDVIGTDIAIARMMNVTADEFLSSIDPLLAPDPDSNSQEREGRRIVPSENGRGYHIVNYLAYREMKSDEEKREYMRNYMRQRRANSKESVKPVKICKAASNVVTQAEAEAEADSKNTPLPPQGGNGESLKKPKDNLPTNPHALKIAELFRRKPTTPWSAKEIKAFKAIPREALEELETVCRYTRSEMEKGNNGRHRRDLMTFLNNFQGELDRARQQQPATPSAPKQYQFIED